MNKIRELFNEDFQPSTYIRVGNNKKIRFYVGKDEDSLYSFEFRGRFVPHRLLGSEVISVQQFQNNAELCLRFSLKDIEFLDCFCIFCSDLLESTNSIEDDVSAYNELTNRYLSWRKLFSMNHGIMSENEIMGLVGELLYLKDYIVPNYGAETALDCWVGPDKTHKDFSVETDWFEIKAINTGKETIRISSIEQLDAEINGHLVVYKLERMSPSFHGISLNMLVEMIVNILKSRILVDIFYNKLSNYGYNFSSDYDNYVYSVANPDTYLVTSSFPKMSRGNLPLAIGKIQYELFLSEIEPYKI